MQNGRNHRNSIPRKPDIEVTQHQDIVAGTEKKVVGTLEGANDIQLIPSGRLIRYDYPFVSSSSGLMNLERQFVEENLGKNAVKVRVYCIRHGMSVQEKEGKKFQTDDTPLYDDARKQYGEITNILQKVGVKAHNTYLLFSEGTREEKVMRVVQSAGLLAQSLNLPPDRVINDVDDLDTTDKDDEIDTRRKLKTASDTSRFTAELQKALRGDVGNINVICVIHKSNIAAIEETLFGQGKHSITLDARELKPGGIVTFDFDENGEAIDYKSYQDVLQFSIGNHVELTKILSGEPDLEAIIKEFELQDIQLWELQNYVNAYFHANPQLYVKYLISQNQDLSVFCLVNLLSRPIIENEKSIRSYMLAIRVMKQPFSLAMLEIFLKWDRENVLTKEALLWSILFAAETTGKNIESLCGTLKCSALYGSMKDLTVRMKTLDATAKGIFDKSLDTMVKERQLLSRTLYTYQKKTVEEIKKLKEEKGILTHEDEYTRIPTTLSSILNASGPQVLLGHVGEGKSTELARMKEEIDTHPFDNDAMTLFYSGKVNNERNIIEKIQSDIQAIQAHFPEKQVIIFFDGIDELDGTIRESVVADLKSLHSATVRVILGSRPIGFDMYENKGIDAIHFGSIDAKGKNHFLLSRLESLGVHGAKGKKRLKKVLDFLARPILSSELKETPLILYFLTRLCVSGRLQTIRNRADLYEEITKLILIEHQRKKGIDSSGHWSVDVLLDTLSYCAYHMHPDKKIEREDILGYLRGKIQGKIGLSDEKATVEAMADQIFLLYQMEGGEYQFILKSFEEYFLARYIQQSNTTTKDSAYPHATEGESLIYKMRDTNTDTWNNWRNFRPVVLFYGEMLGNSGDTAGLARLLGDEGLLQHDDMFGEGFFMGLEILYALPENIRESQDMRSIWQRYEKEVKSWKIGDVIKKIEPIKRFSSAVGYMDTILSDRIVELIKKIGVEGLYALKFERVFSPNITEYYLNNIQKILDYKKGELAVILFKSFAQSGYQDGIKAVITGVRALEDKKSYKEAPYVFYSDLAESRTQEGIQAAIEGAKRLEDRGEHQEAVSLYSALARSRTQEGIQAAIEGAKRFNDKKWYEAAELLYSDLAESRTQEGIQAAIEGAKRLEDRGEHQEAVSLYSSLAESGNQEGIQAAIEGVQKYVNKKSFIEAIFIYSSLVKSGTQEGIQAAISGISILEEKVKIFPVGILHASLAESGNQEGIQIVIKWVRKLEDKRRYEEAGFLYTSLAKSGNNEGVQLAIKGAKRLEDSKEYQELVSLYTSLVKSGTQEGIQVAIKGAKRLEDKQEYYRAASLYTSLVKSGTQEGIQAAINGAKRLEDSEEHHEVVVLYSSLIHSGNYVGIQAAMKWAKRLEDSQEYYSVVSLYSSLAESGTQEGIQAAIEGAKRLEDSQEYYSVVSLYSSLAESGTQEGIQAAIEGAKRLEDSEEHQEAVSLYSALARSRTQEGIQAAVECSQRIIKKGKLGLIFRIFDELYLLPKKIV